MKFLIIFCCYIHVFTIYSNAQPGVKDSFLTVLKLAKDDTAKVKSLNAMADAIENNEPAEAAKYAKEAEALSLKLSFKDGHYMSLISLSQTYFIRGMYDSSIIILTKALQLASQMNDKIKIASTRLSLGTAHREKGDFEKAMEHCMEGKKIIEGTDNNLLKGKMDDVLQVLYYSRAAYDKGIIHGERALKMARQSKDEMFLLQCLVNLSMNYNSVHKYIEAENLLKESLAISKARGNKRVEAASLMNLADIALDKRNADQLKYYSRQSLKLNHEIGSTDGESLALRAIAIGFLLEANTDSANWYARKALKINSENNLKKETIEILNLLAHISFASGKMREGFDFSQQFTDSLEFMVTDVISQQSAELEKKYEAEKKQIQITQLQSEALLQQYSIRQKSILNYILAGSAAAILIISLLSYRTYRHKQKLQQQKINTLETEKQLTATEAVLKGEEQERTRLAKDLHDGLGGMLSGIKFSFNSMKGNLIMTPENNQAFERSIDMLDNSIKEMRRVAHNMMPEILVKFGLDTALKDFCNDINQSGALQVNYQSIGMENLKIGQTTSITIYRVIQELVNNIMKHAAAKTALVQLANNNGHLIVTIEDDGKGFDTSMLQNAKGIGWTNIQNRVDFLQGSVDVQSEIGNGTSVHIEINV